LLKELSIVGNITAKFSLYSHVWGLKTSPD